MVLSNIFYTLCVHYLLDHTQEEDKGIKAFNFAKGCIKTENKEFLLWINSMESSFNNRTILETDAPINKASGWIRVALSYSIHFLVCSKSFK